MKTVNPSLNMYRYNPVAQYVGEFLFTFFVMKRKHFQGLIYCTFSGFMALFSLSNGYLSQICMMSAPQLVKGAEAQTAGSLMVALLGLGLGSGALVSYPVKFLL